MKKTLIAFALTTAAVWAAPEGNVYHTISDPTWHVTRIGSRWVIEDSRGFFVGYYVPQPAPPVAAPAAPAATATNPPTSVSGNGASQGNPGDSYYDNGAFGNYNSYRNNGVYGNNYYNNGYYYNNNGNCTPQFHPQNPPPERDKPEVPASQWRVGVP